MHMNMIHYVKNEEKQQRKKFILPIILYRAWIDYQIINASSQIIKSFIKL